MTIDGAFVCCNGVLGNQAADVLRPERIETEGFLSRSLWRFHKHSET